MGADRQSANRYERSGGTANATTLSAQDGSIPPGRSHFRNECFPRLDTRSSAAHHGYMGGTGDRPASHDGVQTDRIPPGISIRTDQTDITGGHRMRCWIAIHGDCRNEDHGPTAASRPQHLGVPGFQQPNGMIPFQEFDIFSTVERPTLRRYGETYMVTNQSKFSTSIFHAERTPAVGVGQETAKSSVIGCQITRA